MIKEFLSKLLTNPFKDKAKVIGRVKIELFDKNGKVKLSKVFNTIETAGKNMICDRLLASPTLGVPTHMAIGTGTPSAGSLGSVLDTNALTSKTRNNNVLTMIGDWAAGDGTGAITEAGIRDAAAGNYLATTSFSVINKGAADTLQITWTWTIG